MFQTDTPTTTFLGFGEVFTYNLTGITINSADPDVTVTGLVSTGGGLAPDVASGNSFFIAVADYTIDTNADFLDTTSFNVNMTTTTIVGTSLNQPAAAGSVQQFLSRVRCFVVHRWSDGSDATSPKLEFSNISLNF